MIPDSGRIGSLVELTGINFNPVHSNNIVYFGHTRASILSGNSSSLIVKVPIGAVTNTVSVTSSSLIAFSQFPFKVSFKNETGIDTSSFAEKQNFVSSVGPWLDGPWDVKSIDADIDGKTDLISANGRFAATSSIFENIGLEDSINLGNRVDIIYNPPFGNISGAYKIAVADFDGDGKEDYSFINNSGLWEFKTLLNTSALNNISFNTQIAVPTSFPGIAITAADFNLDGKVDIAAAGGNGFSAFKNTSITGSLSFSSGAGFSLNAAPSDITSGDLNNDSKPDLLVCYSNFHMISVILNASTTAIAFSPNWNLEPGTFEATYSIRMADIDLDGDNDIILATRNRISVLRNEFDGFALGFDAPLVFVAPGEIRSMEVSDIDGDLKPDIILGSFGQMSVLINKSSFTNISFSVAIKYDVGIASTGVSIGDFNNDGKPDISTANALWPAKTISVFKNKAGEQSSICSGGNGSIVSNVLGTNYQWQVNEGSGFSNLSDNAVYSGVNSEILNLTAAPGTYFNYQYRCIVDGAYVAPVYLRFGNKWTGAQSTSWEEPANWSCASLPDSNTDVVISVEA